MLTTILIAIGLILGIPLAILALFLCLPIRAGATGYYRENDYSISGFARGCAGLCGIICDIDKKGMQLRVVIGRWTAWRPREKPPSSEPTTESERDTATEPQRDRPKSYPTTKPSYWSRMQTLRAKTKQYLNYAADVRPILTRVYEAPIKNNSISTPRIESGVRNRRPRLHRTSIWIYRSVQAHLWQTHPHLNYP